MKKVKHRVTGQVYEVWGSCLGPDGKVNFIIWYPDEARFGYSCYDTFVPTSEYISPEVHNFLKEFVRKGTTIPEVRMDLPAKEAFAFGISNSEFLSEQLDLVDELLRKFG